MIRLLQSSWLTPLVGCVLYLGVTLALITPARLPISRHGEIVADKMTIPNEPSWNFKNAEFSQWLEDIRREKEAQALRGQQLQDLQTRLEAERQELISATQTVYRLQAEFDKNVLRISTQELDNLKRQAKVIAGMSPEGAAGILNQMPEEDAVRILFAMKADEASAILDTLSKIGKIEAKRAAYLTERMRHTLPPETSPPPRSTP